MCDEILALAKAERGIGGSFFWSAVGPAFSEPDAFSVALRVIPQKQAQDLAAQLSYLVEGSINHVLQGSGHGVSQEDDLEHPCSDPNVAEEEPETSGGLSDEAVLSLIVDHASHMSSLNVGWLPECPVM